MNRAHSRIRPRGGGAPGGGAGFLPGSLFAAGERGLWLDPSDLTTMFQDSAGATPVTGAGQVVGLIQDKSGNGNNAFQDTEANKPILRNALGLWWLEFDGVDDYLETKPIDLTSTDKISAWAGQRKISDSLAAVLFESSANINLNDGTFAINAPNSAASASYTFRSKGSILREVVAAGFSAPVTNAIFMMADISGDSISSRVDGANFGPVTTDQGLGNYGNNALYVGRRAGATIPFAGFIYSLILRGALSDAASILGAEKYTERKSGVGL